VRGVAWLMAAVLAAVIAGHLLKRAEDPQTQAVRAAIENYPLSEAEKEHVVEAFKNRDRFAPAPQDVSDTVLSGARAHQLPADGPLRIEVSYGEGAWYLYDRDLLRHWTGEQWMRSLDAALDARGNVGVAGGVATVSWCQDGDAPLDIALRDRAPERHADADAVTDFDLDLTSGKAVIEGNGDGAAQAIVTLPADRYRARLSLTGRADCEQRQRFALDLWPRRRDTPPLVAES
jgi:hypothetical protein